MTPDEFIEQAVLSGYVPGKNVNQQRNRALEWLLRNPKQSYTPDDFVAIYQYFDYPKRGEEVQNGRWVYEGDGNRHTAKHTC